MRVSRFDSVCNDLQKRARKISRTIPRNSLRLKHFATTAKVDRSNVIRRCQVCAPESVRSEVAKLAPDCAHTPGDPLPVKRLSRAYSTKPMDNDDKRRDT